MRYFLTLILSVCGLFISSLVYSGEKVPGSTVKFGAEIYHIKCSLCHGVDGYGDGLMALSLKDYPNTNLHKNKYGSDDDSFHEAIMNGGMNGRMNNKMPPWFQELSAIQIDSLILFLGEMIETPDKIKALVESVSEPDDVEYMGRKYFENYCALCHGKEGKGDGKMAKIIKEPPPYNLTLSTIADDYLRLIISNGGEKLGRSERMPPFGEQFSKNEIDSIMKYVKTLRKVTVSKN